MWKFKGSELFFTILILGAFIPYQVMLYPIVIMLREAGLYGSLTGLVLVHVVFGMPINTLAVPELFRLDPGPSSSRRRGSTARGSGVIYFRIVMPMSLPPSSWWR